MFFLPYLQMLPSDWSNSAWARSNFVQDIQLRIDSSARDLDVQVSRTLEDVDPNLTVLKLATFGEQLSRNFNPERLIARLTEVFGLLALALACLGLYGVTAYSLARRPGGLALRTELGASRGTL